MASASQPSPAETAAAVPYFRAKWAMEEAVRGSGVEHVIFRPSFVFGRDGGVLPMFIRQVLAKWVQTLSAHDLVAIMYPLTNIAAVKRITI